jgi:DNA-directed RNA polymerase subunit RPC12/RpoP
MALIVRVIAPGFPHHITKRSHRPCRHLPEIKIIQPAWKLSQINFEVKQADDLILCNHCNNKRITKNQKRKTVLNPVQSRLTANPFPQPWTSPTAPLGVQEIRLPNLPLPLP